MTFSFTAIGSEGYGPSRSLSAYTEEHLVFNHTQPTKIQIHSTTPTRRVEISATELGTSGKCTLMCVCVLTCMCVFRLREHYQARCSLPLSYLLSYMQNSILYTINAPHFRI